MTQITFSIKFIREVPEETHVVTTDIKSLFKNIPTWEGIADTKLLLVKSHQNILDTYTYVRHRYFQLQELLPNQRVYDGNCMSTMVFRCFFDCVLKRMLTCKGCFELYWAANCKESRLSERGQHP